MTSRSRIMPARSRMMRRPAPRLRRRWSLLALVVFTVGIAGCGGIPTDAQPVAISEELLAEELRPAEPEPTPIAAQFDPEAYIVYLIGQNDDGDILEGVSRDLSVNASAADVIEQLLAGPLEEESEESLTTAIPADLTLIEVQEPRGGTVTVNVAGGPLERLSPEELRIAVAQLVFTVTDLAQISSLRLQVDGVPSSLPRDGQDSSPEEPVTRNDYRSVDPSADDT